MKGRSKIVAKLRREKAQNTRLFFRAIEQNDLKSLKKITTKKFFKPLFDVNCVNPQNKNAIQFLISEGIDKFYNQQLLDYLIQIGVNVDGSNRFISPLELAIEGGHADVVDRLLDAGAQPLLAKGGNLLFAVKCNQSQIVKVLLNRGADLNKIYNNDEHIIYPAIECANQRTGFNIIRQLIEAGLKLHIKNKKGITPLMRAVELEKLEIVKGLINAEEDVNAIDDEGQNVLMKTIHNKDTVILDQLLKHGALLNWKDYHNNSILALTIRHTFNTQLINYLAEKDSSLWGSVDEAMINFRIKFALEEKNEAFITTFVEHGIRTPKAISKLQNCSTFELMELMEKEQLSKKLELINSFQNDRYRIDQNNAIRLFNCIHSTGELYRNDLVKKAGKILYENYNLNAMVEVCNKAGQFLGETAFNDIRKTWYGIGPWMEAKKVH